VEFDYAIIVLKDSMKDYDITRAKLVISTTHCMCVLCHDILTVYVVTQFVFADLDPPSYSKNIGSCTVLTLCTVELTFLTTTIGDHRTYLNCTTN
jgi:hypothetical protein